MRMNMLPEVAPVPQWTCCEQGLPMYHAPILRSVTSSLTRSNPMTVMGWPAAPSDYSAGLRLRLGRRLGKAQGACDAHISEDAFRPLKVGDVHFGHYFYGRLDIAKVRQEHFALKRRVRFRRHVVAVVDTLD